LTKPSLVFIPNFKIVLVKKSRERVNLIYYKDQHGACDRIYPVCKSNFSRREKGGSVALCGNAYVRYKKIYIYNFKSCYNAKHKISNDVLAKRHSDISLSLKMFGCLLRAFLIYIWLYIWLLYISYLQSEENYI
jgi:hypothetical protein